MGAIRRKLLLNVSLLTLQHGWAQSRPASVKPILDSPVQTADVAAYQLSQYLIRRSPELPGVSSAVQWAEESRRLRRKLFETIVCVSWMAQRMDKCTCQI
jgi:hypothetical protein